MMKTENTSKKELLFKRGDIVECDLGTVQYGVSRQFGKRPCVVISNNVGNTYAPCITVVPMTTRLKASLPTHCRVAGTKEYCLVLCEQAATIDKKQIIHNMGHVSSYEQRLIDKALKVALDL